MMDNGAAAAADDDDDGKDGECGNYNLKQYTDVANNMSRMNSSGHIGHATVFCWTFTIACCLVGGSGLGLGLGLDLVSAW